MDLTHKREQEKKEEYKKMRKVWRAKADTQVQVFHGDKVLSGITNDFGEGGLKFEISEIIPDGTIVLIQIPVIGLEKIQAKILESWTLRVGTVIHRCQFVNISQVFKNEMLKFIFNKIR